MHSVHGLVRHLKLRQIVADSCPSVYSLVVCSSFIPSLIFLAAPLKLFWGASKNLNGTSVFSPGLLQADSADGFGGKMCSKSSGFQQGQGCEWEEMDFCHGNN